MIDSITAIAVLMSSAQRLNREQWLAADRIAEIKQRRFATLLREAAKAPYYATLFRQLGLDPLRECRARTVTQLPFLDRQIIAAHGIDAFLTTNRRRLFSVTTSGSTGTPGVFMRSVAEEAEFSARWRRVYAAYGCGSRDAQVNVARADKPDRIGPSTLLRRLGILPPVTKLASNAPAEQIANVVRKLEPPILTGYAAAIEALAEHIIATGKPIRPPRAVFCTAMEVTDHCLDVAQRAFHAPSVDVYVTNEFGVIAWSCPKRRDYLHVNDDTFEVEIVGEDGKPVPDGTEGEIVVTSLGLSSMPLLRYRMGDIAARTPGVCTCGRGLGLMTCLKGRTAHAIRRQDGGLITGPLITGVFGACGAYRWVRSFQLREEQPRRLHILIERRRSPIDDEKALLLAKLTDAIGPGFTLNLAYVEEIPVAPNGKRQFIVPLPRETATTPPRSKKQKRRERTIRSHTSSIGALLMQGKRDVVEHGVER